MPFTKHVLAFTLVAVVRLGRAGWWAGISQDQREKTFFGEDIKKAYCSVISSDSTIEEVKIQGKNVLWILSVFFFAVFHSSLT